MIPIRRIWTEQSVVCDCCGHRESEMDISRTKFQKILNRLGYKMRDGKIICPKCFKNPKNSNL